MDGHNFKKQLNFITHITFLCMKFIKNQKLEYNIYDGK